MSLKSTKKTRLPPQRRNSADEEEDAAVVEDHTDEEEVTPEDVRAAFSAVSLIIYALCDFCMGNADRRFAECRLHCQQMGKLASAHATPRQHKQQAANPHVVAVRGLISLS